MPMKNSRSGTDPDDEAGSKNMKELLIMEKWIQVVSTA